MANRCLSVMLVLVGISMVYVGVTGISVTWVTTWPVVLVGAGILLIGVAVARCMVTFRVVDECECHAAGGFRIEPQLGACGFYR